jgi:hypothetical protein
MTIVWVDAKYGQGCHAILAQGLRLLVAPDGIATRHGPPVPYRVEVFASTLQKRFTDRDEAKAFAEKAARHWLAAALKSFDCDAVID